MLRKFFRSKATSLLSRLGYQLTKTGSEIPLDMRGVDDPRAFPYFSNRTLLVNVPTAWGRRCYFKLAHGEDPFVTALTAAKNSADFRKTVEQYLRAYYKLVQPKDAYSWFGLAPDELLIPTKGTPMAQPRPWENFEVESRQKAYERNMLQENKVRGRDLDLSHGVPMYGPTSEEKLQLEADRLTTLYERIKQEGYQRGGGRDQDISVAILEVESGEWRYIIKGGGNHRAVVLAALGHQKAPPIARSRSAS